MCPHPFTRFLRAVIDHWNSIVGFPGFPDRIEQGCKLLPVIVEGMVECVRDDGNTGPLVNGEAVAEGV